MAEYKKPVAMAADGVAEGVFAASGAVAENNCDIDVWVKGWRYQSYSKRWIVQIGFSHTDHDHLVKETVLHITLDRPASFVSDSFFGYEGIGACENTTEFQIQITGGGIYNKVGDLYFISDAQPNIVNIYATHN